MPAPPSYQKVNPGDQSIFFIILRSPTLQLSQLDEIALSCPGNAVDDLTGLDRAEPLIRRPAVPRTD